MFQAVQRDWALSFDGFFIVGVALGVFVAHVLAPAGRQLLAAGERFRLIVGQPADARAQLMGVVDRHAIGHRAAPVRFSARRCKPDER